MRSLSIFFCLCVLFGCASSSTTRPKVETEPYPDAEFSGVLDHDYYVTVSGNTDPSDKQKKEGVRYVRSDNPDFEPPDIVGGREVIQDTLETVTKGFTCPVRGTVYVSALLDRQGEVRAPQLRAGINKRCDKKALEVMKRIQLQSATFEGEPISVLFTLPVTFE